MAAILGAILAVALMTSGVYTIAQRATGKGKAALDRIRTANTNRREARQNSRRPASGPAPWAVRSGSGVSAFWHAAGLFARAGREGWDVGWEQGRARALDWWERRQPESQSEQPTVTTQPVVTQPPTPQPQPIPQAAPESQPQQPPVQGPSTPAPTNNVVPIRKKDPMAINTTTGGEVVDIETALAEARAMLKEAQTELEDASADMQRAAEDATRVERYQASFNALDFPQRGKDLATALAQSNTDRQAAAQRRHAAAEGRTNEAQALVTYLQKHQELQAAAAEVGGMAGKQAYA